MRVIGFPFTILLLFSLACSRAEVRPPDFNGDRAFSYLVQQVAFGPRVPGSDAWKNCRAFLDNHFTKLGLAVDSQFFTFTDPYSGATKPLVNIIVHLRPGDAPPSTILLVAHYDSRPRTEHNSDPARTGDSLPGANDGASGAAVLMELANLFASAPTPTNVDMLLVDGEDWGKEGDPDYYLLGARHFASSGTKDQYAFAILLDMVGDKDQTIYREQYSERFHKPLNDLVWQTARQLHIATFIDSVKYAIMDDHLPLNVAGIPAIDLIDFDYPHWHSERDTPDKCSPQALANVGQVLAKIIYNPSSWPRK